MTRKVKFYDLDVIISVGYRVHSKRGTAFRIWARQIIKDYLVKGYAVNQRIHSEQIGELRQLVQMLGRTIQNQQLEQNGREGRYGEGCSKPNQPEERISKTIQIIKEKAPKWMPLFLPLNA